MKNIRIDKRLFYVYVIFFAICVIAILAATSLEKKETKKIENYMSDWETTENISLKKVTKTIEARKKLEELTESKTIIVEVKSLMLQAYIDGKLIYDNYTEVSNYLGKTPGTYYAKIELIPEYSNKELELKIINPYKKSGKITKMYIGNGIEEYNRIIKNLYFSSCICFTIIIFGIAAIILFFPMFHKKIAGAKILYLGFFSISAGSFMLFDNKLLPFIYGHEYLFHTLDEFSMMLIVVPLILFINKFYKCNKNAIAFICASSLILSITSFTLNFFRIYDIHETIFLIHISYIIGIAYLLIIVFKNIFSKDKKWSHFIGINCICIGGILDLILYYINLKFETTLFLRLGVLGFLGVEFATIIKELIDNHVKEMKQALLGKLAYHDGLTNLLNRTSFMEDMETYKDNENMIIVVFDVNDLKKINDTKGHLVGDQLIMTASKAIDKYFSEFGKVYRIGGDEFVVLIEESLEKKQIVEAYKNMERYLSENLLEDKILVKVAYGMAKYNKNKHDSLQDTFKEADELMYQKKQEMKKEK